MEKYKLYCIFAKESIDLMKGVRGKLTAQAGHAFLHGFWDAEKRFPEYARNYRDSQHAYKITLVVPTVEDLMQLEDAYREVCGVSLVKDAGFTVFEQATITCLGLGPIPESLIGENLKTIKTLT